MHLTVSFFARLQKSLEVPIGIFSYFFLQIISKALMINVKAQLMERDAIYVQSL